MAYPISDVPRRIVYSGSAGVGPYAFTFEVLANTDIAVYKNTTLLTLTTDYTVSINAGTGTGTVTLVVAATGSDTVTIVGDRAIQRTSDFVTGGDLFANTLNDELDAQVIYTQQVDEKADRAIKAPITDPTTINMVLPALATRASKLLGFNAGGNPTVTTSTVSQIDAAVASFVNATGNNAASIAYDPAGTGAVATTVQAKLRETVSVKDFGAVGDGVADDTAAIQAAIDASYTNYNKTVFVPNGIYKITGRLTITQGVMIACEGSQGSNEAYGTVFKHYSNGSCFRWDGSGAQFTGTGGGLLNCLIVKVSGYSGGNAIEVINQSDTNRCGEMVFHNVLAYGLSTGRWERGFVFDGTLTNTPGARGVRTVHMTKCRAADVTTANETVLLNQVTHFYAHGLAVDAGSGAAAGITIKGINDGIYLTALGLAGTLTVVANDATNSCNNLVVDGKIGGSVTINDNQVDGALTSGMLGGISVKSKRFKVISRSAPYFMATRISSASNVTGDGTSYQLAFDNEVVDTCSNFGTNTFTCTVAGTYQFSFGAFFTGLTSSHTMLEIGIVQTGSQTLSFSHVSNPYAQAAGGTQCSTERTVTVDLEFGDTVYVSGYISGGTKVVTFYGTTGSSAYGFFCGKYLP